MDSILVTGGAGFIGGAFVRATVANQAFRVVNLDKLTYAGNPASLKAIEDAPYYHFIQGDINDGPLVSHLLEKYRPRGVVHFAAESHVDRSIDGPLPFVETNVVGTVRLLEAARSYWQNLPPTEADAFRFLHVSTDEVYGSLGDTGAFDEEHPYQPNSPYSASKAASDHFVRAYHHTYGLPTLITNCSNNYGPYQFPEKLIPLMTLNALSGKPLPVYGDGLNVRDWLFVEDHCAALACVLKHGRLGETYNIGGNSERTNLQVVQAICDTVDRLTSAAASSRKLITFVTDRPGHDFRYAIDSSKLQRELGWQPSVDFEAGLERTVRWYLENSTWVHNVTSGQYRAERLGLGPARVASARAA